jgi:hypothetical protein
MDAALLYGETPAMHMHASALTILDPAPAEVFDVEVFRDVVESRLERLVPLRQRLAAVPFGLDRPVWVDDHAFDGRTHIRPIAVV